MGSPILGSYKEEGFSPEIDLKRDEYQRRYQHFLGRLRQARKDAGLRQEDVRQRIHTYQSYMSKIESGERRVDIVELQELADLYGKPLSYFTTRKGALIVTRH